MSSKKNRRKRTAPTGPHPSTRERAQAVGAATPTDHARSEATGELIHVTVRGIDLSVDPAALNDFRVLDAAAHGNPTLLFDAVAGDQREQVLTSLEDEHGRIPLESLGDWLSDAQDAIRAGRSGN